MLKEHYIKILDFFTEWKDGVDTYHISKTSSVKKKAGRPRKDADDEYDTPLNTYPVVLAHKPQQVQCEWCPDQCSSHKTYRRSPTSNIWLAKCSDCGEKRNIHTTQIDLDK
jgi:hypothetical protein